MDNAKLSANLELLEAVRNRDAAKIKRSISRGADDKTQRSFALKTAADKGYYECVALLIPISDPKDNHSLALACAAHNGHLECVKLLIPVSDPHAEHSRALRWAVDQRQRACVALLLPVSDPMAKEGHGSNASEIARANGYSDIALMIDVVVEANARSNALSNSLPTAAPAKRAPSL